MLVIILLLVCLYTGISAALKRRAVVGGKWFVVGDDLTSVNRKFFVIANEVKQSRKDWIATVLSKPRDDGYSTELWVSLVTSPLRLLCNHLPSSGGFRATIYNWDNKCYEVSGH